MNNFAVLDLKYTHYENGLYVCLKTDRPCHLTCYWTFEKPGRHRTARNQRGLTLPWGVYFCFVAWKATEQIEAGDTIYHRFNLFIWQPLNTAYLAFRGTIASELSPSVSPIFEHWHPGGLPMTPVLRPYWPGDLCTIAREVGAPCPDHWRNVDDIVPDEDESYVFQDTPSGTTWGTDLYKIERGTLEKINLVIITARFKSFGTRPTTRVVQMKLKTHDIIYALPTSSASSVWSDSTWRLDNNPFTGQPWTQNELDNLQIGITLGQVRGLGWGQRGYCTQNYITIYRAIICPDD